MQRHYLSKFFLVAGISAISGSVTAAMAQTASMAPPVTQAAPATDQTTYNWQDVPLNQDIPIARAVFDQGGYQLYDTTGETIVIPFVNNNLYVMKFGQTSGGMYFVNDGTTPTLYVPAGGYLENSAADGAKWYPFAPDFVYLQPIYIGPAPSWNAYLSMGWYPGMSCYGGYWGYHPYTVGLKFSPMGGLSFNIFGTPYQGWRSYRTYYNANPGRRVVLRQAPVFGHYSVGRRGPSGFPIARALAGKPGRHFSGAKSGGAGHHGAGKSGGAFGAAQPGGRPGGSFGGGNRPAQNGTPNNGGRPGGSFGGGNRPTGGGNNKPADRTPRMSLPGGSNGGGHSSGGGSGGGHPGGGGGGGGDKKKP